MEAASCARMGIRRANMSVPRFLESVGWNVTGFTRSAPETHLAKSDQCVLLHYAHTIWHEILAGVIFGGCTTFRFFPQDWQIIIWRTDLDRALHTQTYMYIHTSLAKFNLAVLSHIHQSAKLNSSPIFHAIIMVQLYIRACIISTL